MTPETIRKLAEPLDPKHIATRKQSGVSLAYIEGWHAIAEANRIFGHGAWASETVDIRCVAEKPRKIGRDNPRDGWSVSYVAKVRVVADGVTREGVGAGHGIDVDLGLAHESAIKEAETDARKRALMTFGWPFGLALYDKRRENVGTVEQEPETDPAAIREYVSAALTAIEGITDPPKLTEWWNAEADVRRDFGVTKGTEAYDQIYRAVMARGNDLKGRAAA